MKVIGGVFVIMILVVGGCTSLGIMHYARPLPLHTVTMLSASASSDARRRVHALVQQYQGISFYPAQAVDLIQHVVPALEKVAVYRQPQGYRVALLQQKPVCIINKTQVLTKSGKAVHKDQFAPAVVEQLFAYTVAHQDGLQEQQTQEHVRFARTFDTDILRHYSVAWIDWSRIELIDTQDRTMRMIVSADMPLSPDLFKAYQEVKKELKSIPVGKKGRTWQVDMRFKNQILVC